MRDALLALGVPDTAIRCEAQSRITVENFCNARRMLGDIRRPRVLIVTSDYHMLRSKLICRFSGHMRCAGCAARIPSDEKREAVRLEPLHTIDYILGYQSGRFKRPKLYSRIMHRLMKR